MSKLRVVSLWGGQLEVLCTGAAGSTSPTISIPATGSEAISLDDQVSILTLKHFQVGVQGMMSDPLWFEQNATVKVPGCQGDVVAQLLTPEPNHRLLLLAPALRIHNCTVPWTSKGLKKRSLSGCRP